jgi:SET domain-containing protein
VEVHCRCEDANLIDIPVQIDKNNKSMYYVAFFTEQDIRFQEELTWDYGCDFSYNDLDLPSFACKCRSRSCRDKVSLVINLQ